MGFNSAFKGLKLFWDVKDKKIKIRQSHNRPGQALRFLGG